jgi:hypothetical protein
MRRYNLIQMLINGVSYEYIKGLSTDWSIVSYYKIPEKRQYRLEYTESVFSSVKITVDKRAEPKKVLHEILILNENGVAIPRCNCKTEAALDMYNTITKEIEAFFNMKEV